MAAPSEEGRSVWCEAAGVGVEVDWWAGQCGVLCGEPCGEWRGQARSMPHEVA